MAGENASSCVAGTERFHLTGGDVEGFCGIRYDDRCLPHYIYVPEPSGSVNENSGGEIVWGAEGIATGYVCVADPTDPAFQNPPPDGICPEGYYRSVLSTELQYICYLDKDSTNIELEPTCAIGYGLVEDEWCSSEQGINHYFTCGLDGFRNPSYCADPFASCGNSGAQFAGANYWSYSCAYTTE